MTNPGSERIEAGADVRQELALSEGRDDVPGDLEQD